MILVVVAEGASRLRTSRMAAENGETSGHQECGDAFGNIARQQFPSQVQRHGVFSWNRSTAHARMVSLLFAERYHARQLLSGAHSNIITPRMATSLHGTARPLLSLRLRRKCHKNWHIKTSCLASAAPRTSVEVSFQRFSSGRGGQFAPLAVCPA